MRVFLGFAPSLGRADTWAQRRGWALARELTAPFWRAALAKLASRFPKDAKKGLTSLIRWHFDDAYTCCAQAVEWATDLLLRDLEAHPRDPLSARVPRVLALANIDRLPSYKGRRATGVGRAYNLQLLVRYEAWLVLLADEFPGNNWAGTECLAREEQLARFLATLDSEARPPGPWPLTPELLRAACAQGTREGAALTIVAGTASFTRLTPRSLKDLLRKTRPLARRLDA